jgi:hypothetical protein
LRTPAWEGNAGVVGDFILPNAEGMAF